MLPVISVLLLFSNPEPPHELARLPPEVRRRVQDRQRQLRAIILPEPVAAADRAINRGDIRLWGYPGLGFNIPGTRYQGPFQPAPTCGSQSLPMLGDVVLGPEDERLQESARRWASVYNTRVITRTGCLLPAPPLHDAPYAAEIDALRDLVARDPAEAANRAAAAGDLELWAIASMSRPLAGWSRSGLETGCPLRRLPGLYDTTPPEHEVLDRRAVQWAFAYNNRLVELTGCRRGQPDQPQP